jgi:hypothetical protein
MIVGRTDQEGQKYVLLKRFREIDGLRPATDVKCHNILNTRHFLVRSRGEEDPRNCGGGEWTLLATGVESLPGLSETPLGDTEPIFTVGQR